MMPQNITSIPHSARRISSYFLTIFSTKSTIQDEISEKNTKKCIFFMKKFAELNFCRIFAVSKEKWWIHLRARIHASHA